MTQAPTTANDDWTTVTDAAAATPALPVADPAADAWRAMARVVAWIAVVQAGATLLWLAASLAMGSTSVVGGIYGVRNLFRSGLKGTEILMSLQTVWSLGLLATLAVGAVATLLRLRWGPRVLLAYALGTVPGAALSVAWFVAQMLEFRTQFQQPGRSLALEIVGHLVYSIGHLAFPAVVFVVMSRRAVRDGIASAGTRSAFEPLPVARPVDSRNSPSGF